MKKYFFMLVALTVISRPVQAQHTMHGMEHNNHTMHGMEHKHTAADSNKTAHDTGMHMHGNHSGMHSALSVSLPMSRDGSGTAWNPDMSPMYGYMAHKGNWMFMFHGDLYIRYNKQDIGEKGHRGDDAWDVPGMIMAHAQTMVGKKSIFNFRIMLSPDAVTQGGNGYPLLFQTGESWHGLPLVDRQHPHDLFSELSASYAISFNRKTDAYLYVGYPGEPALGPVAFMHRPSGQFMPDAPIGHHWADATHITFGVGTIGLRYGKLKLEGSSFTGREPDEDRYNFDKPLFDSWSGRLSFNPSSHWATQVSHGFIKSPEALHPAEDISRTTASATYVSSTTHGKYIAVTGLLAQNIIPGHTPSNAALLETVVKLCNPAFYLRYEYVQKTGEELNLDPFFYGSDKNYPAHVIAIGGNYDLFNVANTTIAAGAQLSAYFIDKALQGLYGKHPLSGEVYLHIHPGLMK
jgi:hypothetical protein